MECSLCDSTSESKCFICSRLLCLECTYENNCNNKDYCLFCALSEAEKKRCYRCNEILYGDYNEMKDCMRCSKTYCISCIAFTGCQTNEGYCKICYSYKCKLCGDDISKPYEDIYYDDIKPLPLCDKHKIPRQKYL